MTRWLRAMISTRWVATLVTRGSKASRRCQDPLRDPRRFKPVAKAGAAHTDLSPANGPKVRLEDPVWLQWRGVTLSVALRTPRIVRPPVGPTGLVGAKHDGMTHSATPSCRQGHERIQNG